MKFSIIIPYYNSHNYIKKAIDSLYIQWNNEFEIIIVDDASDDYSFKQLQSIIAEYSIPIYIYRQAVNGGPGKARKDGLKHAKGDYILFLDSDDTFEPLSIQILSELVQDCSDVVLFDCYRITDHRKIKLNTLNNLSIHSTKCDYVALSYDSICTMCVRKTLLLSFDFPEIYNAEDTVSVPLILSKAASIKHTQSALYGYFYRENSLSTIASKRLAYEFIHAWEFLKLNIDENYSDAFHFRLIKLVIYGVTFNWIRAGLSANKLIKKLDIFNKENKNWEKNKYLSTLPIRKRIFIVLVRYRAFSLLKLYVRLQNYLIRF